MSMHQKGGLCIHDERMCQEGGGCDNCQAHLDWLAREVPIGSFRPTPVIEISASRIVIEHKVCPVCGLDQQLFRKALGLGDEEATECELHVNGQNNE